jgi:hypothetical protein
MKFYPRVLGGKLPADLGLLCIASGNPGFNLTAHFLYGWYLAVEALAVYYSLSQINWKSDIMKSQGGSNDDLGRQTCGGYTRDFELL